MTVLELLARAKGGEGVKSGPIGLAVILLLCIAAYFLFKSMSKHLKRVREEFPQDEHGRPPAQLPAQPQQRPASAPDRPTTAPQDPGPASGPGGDGSP